MGLHSLIVLLKIHSSWRSYFLISLECKLSCVDAFSEPNCFHMNSRGGTHRAIEIISIAWGSIQNFQRKVLLQGHIANNTYLLEVLLLKNPIE